MNHTCLCLPSRSWYSFTDPGGMEGWVVLAQNNGSDHRSGFDVPNVTPHPVMPLYYSLYSSSLMRTI